jgi:cation:H+ antiporter
MVWFAFVVSAAVIVLAATQLAKYGDVIAVRTNLGRMFIGVLLLAGATSLPEVLTTINSLSQGVPNLAAGNLMGSNMFNMVMLAFLDIASRNHRILRKAALKHALSGSLATLMIVLVLFFMLADIRLQVGWVGVDGITIMLVYVMAIYLLQKDTVPQLSEPEEAPAGFPTLRRGVIGFTVASAVLVISTPIMVSSSTEIAAITGLGTSFIGTTLVALVTSLPEMVTTLAAIRIGADDMAIGNLFGSNMFNMFAIGLTDVFFLPGRFLPIIDPSFLIVGIIGLLMTVLGLVGNLAKLERRIIILELDALALIIVYIGGLWLLFNSGMVP